VVEILNEEPKVLPLKAHSDERGSLISIEFPEIAMTRFYYIQASDSNSRRGFHAHKNLTQIFVPLAGSWKLSLLKHGETLEITLIAGQNYLLLPPGYWREFESLEDFSILGVLADDVYREQDYIRDLNEFKEWEKLNDSIL
jgi:dTDP-4-dehydrorhamnose 3,5-epimerase-like enzyme